MVLLQYSGLQMFFYDNSKNDSNFVAALHMVQKEENKKAGGKPMSKVAYTVVTHH